MPRWSGYVVIRAGDEWRRVPRALNKENETLPHRARDEVRKHAHKLAAQARRRVRKLPVRGRAGSTGLRKRVAAGVKVVNREGQVRVVTTMPSRDEAIIPRGLDRAAGWRHPVYGNRSNWVVQRPSKPGWFTDTFRDGRDPIKNSLEDEMDQSARRIGRAGNQRGRPG
jgi:hypothetical protein